MMSRRWQAAGGMALMILASTVAIGSVEDPKPADRPAEPPIADRFARIKAEFEAQQAAVRKAIEKAKDNREVREIRETMRPDVVAYSRRMIALAETNPADPSARDALLWVIDKPGRSDEGDYGDQFARAASLLVRHHGDDPLAIVQGIGLYNVLTFHRDALLLGFHASAKGRESKGLARLALAQYLERKAQFAEGARKVQGRRKINNADIVGDDGKLHDLVEEETDEEYAYTLSLRLCDPATIRAEAERLYYEVLEQYGDVPLITPRQRELKAVLNESTPIWRGKPPADEEIREIRRNLARVQTIGATAEARLDDMHHLAEGVPAPEIDGVDIEGRPLKLSDYRGKVVVLVFWGSWCGPCMREIPHEREMVERLKDRPFAILGVDCIEEKSAGLKAIRSEGVTWPIWHDGPDKEGPIAARYHVRGYPSVFVIDPQGKIRFKKVLGTSALDQAVDQLLGELGPKDPPK